MEELKVLLVDDEEEFVTTLSERLGLRGIQAEIATNGEKALALINETRPGIVLLDLMMPGLGGLEVLKKIKAEHPMVKVILLTGRASEKDGQEGIRLGASDCLIKPMTIRELIKKINEVAGRVENLSIEE